MMSLVSHTYHNFFRQIRDNRLNFPWFELIFWDRLPFRPQLLPWQNPVIQNCEKITLSISRRHEIFVLLIFRYDLFCQPRSFAAQSVIKINKHIDPHMTFLIFSLLLNQPVKDQNNSLFQMYYSNEEAFWSVISVFSWEKSSYFYHKYAVISLSFLFFTSRYPIKSFVANQA